MKKTAASSSSAAKSEGTTQMSMFSKLQQRLGSSSTARVEDDAEQMISRIDGEPPFADAVQNASAPAWDPHEVWLRRVKIPREQRSAG
jgi:hypothetical protein